MTKVLLINEDKIAHYRVSVFNYLSQYLVKHGFILTVVAAGIEVGNPYPIEYDFIEMSLTFLTLLMFIIKHSPDVIIFWVRMRNLYLFPILMLTKILRKKAIYWGHGVDLSAKNKKQKKFAHSMQYWLSDALILYGDHLRKYISNIFHYKVFIANNTLNLTSNNLPSNSKDYILKQYNIRTGKNIICVGRMQRRKRLQDLFRAFKLINNREIGLILVGPDTDRILGEFEGNNVYKLGPIYGDDVLALLSAADVYCLPGHVGLGIVDAFYCGLPIVAEESEHAPEIMYLRDGVNGFIVPRGDVKELAAKLQLLLENDGLRKQFSRKAKEEIMKNGNMDKMCKGFSEALKFVSEAH